MSKENLPAVLEVLRHGPEIRERVMQDFWITFEEAFKQRRPTNLSVELSWKSVPDNKSREVFAGFNKGVFDLEARLDPATDEVHALRYCIELDVMETGVSYLGYGLAWVNEEKEFEKKLRLPALQELRRQLERTRRGDLDTRPNTWWIWFEYWNREIYVDLWTWLAQERDGNSFEKEAKSFWSFVEQTHVLVAKANKVLKR
jgi:hypothetical protein